MHSGSDEADSKSVNSQMNALKGGAVPAPKKKKAPVPEEELSSGSDTEGSAGDNDSDETNTVRSYSPKISHSSDIKTRALNFERVAKKFLFFT